MRELGDDEREMGGGNPSEHHSDDDSFLRSLVGARAGVVRGHQGGEARGAGGASEAMRPNGAGDAASP